jgi:hypothetical protein
MGPIFYRRPDGTAVLDLVPASFAADLRALPWLLELGDAPPEVRARLFPEPCHGAGERDEVLREEWQRHVEPELFALLASAREVVQRDLGQLEPPPGRRRRRVKLEIPLGHVPAWVSALNAARLHLGTLHGVTPDDMDGEEPTGDEARQAALTRIHRYGELQFVLIGASEE